MANKTFKVKGNDRAPGSGSGENFEIEVYAHDRDQAEIIARTNRYNQGREHILIGKIIDLDA